MMLNKETKEFQMTAKTFHGLEEVLALELKKIGAKKITKAKRAVYFSGDKSILYKSNLYLRTALKVLKPIYSFTAKSEHELYKKVKKVSWSTYIDLNDTFLVDTTISQSKFFNHSKYVSQKTKDAIVDQFRDIYGRRPSVNRINPKIRVNMHVNHAEITISMDSSGDSLHKRGYRVHKVEAPINEVLAAGIVLLTNWDKKITLKDPMCGSGTILIEAGMIAKNQAPNNFRKNFGFMFWKDYDLKLFQKIKQELINNEVELICNIEGSDYHYGPISASRKNISQVNLSKSVKLKRFNFFDQKKISEKCHIIFNPPYGERLEIKDPDFYSNLGLTLKKYYPSSSVWLITSDLEKVRSIGLKPSKKIPLYNGPLECNLLNYELYE